MTDSELLYELTVVVIELGVFMLCLSVGAIILEIVIPKTVTLLKDWRERNRNKL